MTQAVPRVSSIDAEAPAPPERGGVLGPLRAHPRLVVLGLLVAVAIGAKVASGMKAVPVTATRAQLGTAIEAIYATGSVEADDRVSVKAKAAGSILEILVKEGAVVKKGDLLARIDNPVARFDLVRGRSDLAAASAHAGPNAPRMAALVAQAASIASDLGTARTELGREEALAKTGVISTSQVERARAAVDGLQASLQAIEAQERSVRIDLDASAAHQVAQVQSFTAKVDDTEVRAPIDGVLLAKLIETGEVAAVNQPLFKVGDTRALILEVSVDEADVPRVSDGARGRPASDAAVSLYAFPREVFHGKVFEILPDANRDRKAFLVKLRLDAAPPGLRSGMSAEVNIIAKERPGAVLAPTDAEAAGSVWVVRDGRAYPQPVTVGTRDPIRFEALSGLAAGDLVVAIGQAGLTEGQRVAVTERAQNRLTPTPDKANGSSQNSF